jgi:hypothetical protein
MTLMLDLLFGGLAGCMIGILQSVALRRSVGSLLQPTGGFAAPIAHLARFLAVGLALWLVVRVTGMRGLVAATVTFTIVQFVAMQEATRATP